MFLFSYIPEKIIYFLFAFLVIGNIVDKNYPFVILSKLLKIFFSLKCVLTLCRTNSICNSILAIKLNSNQQTYLDFYSGVQWSI